MGVGLNPGLHAAENVFYHYATPQALVAIFLKTNRFLQSLNLKEIFICSDENVSWEIRGDKNY